MKTIALLLLAAFPCWELNATPASPLKYMVSPFGSSYVFVMNESKDGEVSSGACYRLKRDGGFEKAWEIHGFYAWPEDILLSEDGVFLIRFKKLTQGNVRGSTDFIEIYRNGALSLRKPIGDFVDSKKLEYSPFEFRHALVLSESAGLVAAEELESIGMKKNSAKPNDPWFLRFKTRENVCYAVGVNTGRILSWTDKKEPKEIDAPFPWEMNPRANQ